MRAALPFLVFLSACSPRVTVIGSADAGPPDTLTLTGRVCTTPPEVTGFPTKVVLLVDQSGSMCLTDPPGSQSAPGFCEQLAPPAGVTVPARVRALRALMRQFSATPNTQVALVPFETNVKGVDPSGVGTPFTGFASPGDPVLDNRLSSMQAELGNARDTQGALAYAQALIEADINQVHQTQPELLPRTRYVVLLVSGGPPSPRCSANDSLSVYADDTHPDLTWPDSAPSFCNTFNPSDPDAITGFVPGGDRNQNDQLLGLVNSMLALKAQYHVGDIRLNTVLLFNEQAIATCGPICQDLFGTHQRWPGPIAVPTAQEPMFAHAEATWLMRELATRGGGSFVEFDDTAGLATTTYTQADFSSAAALTVLKRFVVQPLRAVAFQGAWVIDSDGDGAPDSVETANQTNPLLADTDGDGFDDHFELENRAAGFDPLVKDTRGCDPVSPLTPGCGVRDADGDGLSQFAERWLGTDPTQADTDRDGFADGLEARAGLSPTVPMAAGADSDGDGLSDAEELQRGSDPIHADRTFADLNPITTVLDEQQNADGSACYAFTTRNLPLLATPGVPTGVSLFKVWFVGAPQAVTEDVGFWQGACAWARRDGAVLVPSNLVLDVDPGLFRSLPQVSDPMAGACAGMSALTP